MIINTSQLSSIEKVFEDEVTFPKEKYSFKDPLIDILSCSTKASAAKYEDFVEVNITIVAKLILRSAYTLKPFEYTLKTGEEYHFSNTVRDYEDDLTPYKGNIIELDEHLFALIRASLPMAPKAPNEELPSGGDGYRIIDESDYQKEQEESVDHRFDKLDELDFD